MYCTFSQSNILIDLVCLLLSLLNLRLNWNSEKIGSAKYYGYAVVLDNALAPNTKLFWIKLSFLAHLSRSVIGELIV